MASVERDGVALVPLHDQLVSAARFTLHQAVVCLDVPRMSRPGRHGCPLPRGNPHTAMLVAASLELLQWAELAATEGDGCAR